MNILSIPYFAGGISHLIPLFVLHQKYLKNLPEIKNQFLVNNSVKNFLKIKGIDSVIVDYFTEKDVQLMSNDFSKIQKYVLEKHKESFDIVKPSLIIEDTSLTSPLIAEKYNIPRISIQRTGIFRSIDAEYRNIKHIHSMQKGSYTNETDFILNVNNAVNSKFSSLDRKYLYLYAKPKAKIIPGIPTIECLPEYIDNKDSFFYSGPLIIDDIPSENLTNRLDYFLKLNKDKPIIFITTGTVDKTPIEKFIEYFVKCNYAVITTYTHEINEAYKENIFYNKLLPLNYICKISNLVVHQCGSGMYHYPLINKVPSITIGTQCYDREDIAQRLQILKVSGHVPHPNDDPNYFEIFKNLVRNFQNNTLSDMNEIDKLNMEIEATMSNFKIQNVIDFTLS
jgi:UDP:flavonoid glycosyltransferase YjiC (YdhE family)